MIRFSARPAPRAALTALLLAATALSGCSSMERLSRVGQAPAMSPVTSPTQDRDYRPVTMPMPTPIALEPAANSLWRPGARAFFKDQRAKEVGDVMTVVVNIQNERAELSNTTRRTRDNTRETLSVNNFLNQDIIPGTGAVPDIDVTSGSDFRGTGTIQRGESINIKLAAVVLQVLPNGNLAIAGRQEVRVNSELRELQVAGVIRPEDIRSDNTIAWDKIAEARISYGGRGALSDVQQPRYGQQIFDVIFPF
jgi:flagellar L-ring protein precursor FlgH